MPSLASSPAAHARIPIQPPPPSQFTPEFLLVLACAAVGKRARLSDDLPALCCAPLDWDRVLSLAEHHSVTPLVFQALRPRAESVPPAILDELARRYQHNARRNLLFAAELIRILDALEGSGVEVMPYKGPALAQSVYGDLALREFSDLDILVRPSQVQRALAGLAPLGFEPTLQLSPAQQKAYLRVGYEYALDGRAGQNLLEVQWAIVPRFYSVDFNLQALFERSQPGDVAGRPVKILAPEDLLLVLSVHAAKHAWIRLCWLRDIAGVLRSCELDWEVIQARAHAMGIERILDVSLVLAQMLLGASVPDKFSSSRPDDPALSSLCDQIMGHMPDSTEYRTESLEYFRLMLRLRERFTDKVRFATRLAFTPGLGEWSAVRLPAALSPLYRGVRLARLAGRLFTSPKT